MFRETRKHKKTQETWELKCRFADDYRWLLCQWQGFDPVSISAMNKWQVYCSGDYILPSQNPPYGRDYQAYKAKSPTNPFRTPYGF